jgi:HK97 gp10 family phage protein
MKIAMRLEGVSELVQAFDGLPKRLTNRALYELLTDAAEPMRASMASFAPREPGAPDIADNIVISKTRRKADVRDGQEVAVAIGPSKGFFYGFFQEFGTVHHGAQPFARPAFDSEWETALEIIRTDLWTILAGHGIHRPTVNAPTSVQSPGALL